MTRRFEAGAMDRFRAVADLDLRENLGPEALIEALSEADAAMLMLSNRLDAVAFARLAGTRLKIVTNHAVGYDNLDIAAATRAGIWVSNTPDVLTQATAELAWALLLALARRVPEGDAIVRGGQWRGWDPNQLLGASLYGRTLGIVGAGRIGQAMARMGRGFDLELLYYNRSPKPGFEAETGARRVALDELCARADLISLHLPGGPGTHHLIGADLLARVRPGTLLVNTGRGTSLDEGALIAALQSGPLAGAALDVYEHEPAVSEALRALPNTVLTPHIGSGTVSTRRAMALKCLTNIQAALAGERPPDALLP